MSALRSASMRGLSPHRKTLLSHIPPQPDGSASNITRLIPSSAAVLSTSCCCQTGNPQSTYMQSKHAFKRVLDNRKTGVGRGRGPHRQSVSKVLTKVHLSSWAKGNLSSVFNGLGSFAANAPGRLVEEIGRLVKPSKRQSQESSESTRNGQYKDMISESARQVPEPKHVVHCVEQAADIETEREQHTFEKSVEDTNQGISSYFHAAYSSTHYIPVPGKVKKNGKSEEELGWGVFRKIPLPFMDSSTASNKKPVIRKDFVSRTAIEARTRALVASIRTAQSTSSKVSRTQDLCRHLKQYPSGRHEATESKVVPVLLRMTDSGDTELKGAAREALALLGYTEPVRGRGIRILTLDGGGTRGLMTIQCLKKLENLSGRRIFELFDYVCGVSTGALIAAMVCLYRLPLEKCEQLYLEFSRQMFSRGRVMGTGALVWNHAFYDSDQWEKILQSEIGHQTMIEFSRDPLVPKMSAISTLMNTPRMKNFVFRNYNLPPSTYSSYPGSCIHELWQVIRASSAAPGYYEDFPLGDYVHSDGGLSVNNPTAMAVHESRLLWPNEVIQCVVSLGTGRFEPILELMGSNKVSLREKVTKIVDSATDTEGVHIMMTDLMPPGTYFRFNPYLSEDLQLDEIRQEKLDVMNLDTSMYLRKNEPKMKKAVNILKQKRMFHQHAMDYLKFKADSYK
ncbi:calcium-independent phospholipase A2-gamma-like [Babylonia areolata]|uniref:calcium-independent phospholipase A2-gamma-like n=1 Tax=Babylonia areolata TaxID=304850 RepID=UPI003FD44C93